MGTIISLIKDMIETHSDDIRQARRDFQYGEIAEQDEIINKRPLRVLE